MSYINAKSVLPPEVIEMIQDYIDGGYLYVPKREDQKKAWGSNTSTRNDLIQRNKSIYAEYVKGMSTAKLAERYFLSIKSIQRIVLKEKRTLYKQNG